MKRYRFLTIILVLVLILSQFTVIFASMDPQPDPSSGDHNWTDPTPPPTPKPYTPPKKDDEPKGDPGNNPINPINPKADERKEKEDKKDKEEYGNKPNKAQKFEDVYRGLNLVNTKTLPREKVDVITKETSKTKPRKFENPDDLMSRSEFLMAMIQAKKIIEGRKVLNYLRYIRYNGPLNVYQVIESQPVEDSGFLEYMGQLGLDAGTTDIALNHAVLGTNKIISNPNVIELYLVEAYQKGLITLDELDSGPNKDAESLKVFLENTYQKYGAKAPEPKEKVSVRWDPFHGPIVFGLPIDSGSRVGKLFEHDNAAMGQYPQALQPTNIKSVGGDDNKLSEVLKKEGAAAGLSLYKAKWDKIITKGETVAEDKESWFDNSAFWGSSYMYIHNGTKLTSKTGFESLSKFDVYPTNIVSLKTGEVVRNTRRDEKEELQIIRRYSRLKSPNGFAFFLNENITLLEAYQYAAKYLKALDNETDLSKDTVDVINSAYGVNTSSMTAEEAEAVNFLIALGVVDGEDTTLYNSFMLPLTNKRAVDLIYKIKFPDARKKTLPTLTELDKAMLEKGYGKVSINIDKDVKEFPTTYIGKPEESDKPQTAEDIIRETMSDPKNKGEYELIAIRYPNVKDNEGSGRRRRYRDWKNVKAFELMVNDQYRLEIPYQQINSNEYSALEDGSGGYWRIYTVHKDTVTDLKLLVQVDKEDTTKTYTFTGISGPGLYWIDEDNNKFNIRKWRFDEITQGEKPEDKDKDSPVATYLKEKDRQKGFDFIKKLKEIRTRLSMYDEKNSEFKISLRDGLRRIQVNAKNKVEDNEEFYKTLVQTGTFSVKDVARLTRIQSGRLVDEPVWIRPAYAEKSTELKIIRSGLSLEQLKNSKYGEESLITMDGETPKINTENNILKSQGMLDNITLEAVEVEDSEGKKKTVYDIILTPKSKDLKTEMAKFNQFFSYNAGEDSKKVGGYAKLQGENGESLTLISKNELENFDIEALSDKVLFNKVTGQRAFLNTDDNLTMIGNNITQYKDGHIIVNAFGATTGNNDGTETRDESKIFYNLDVILELINDTDLLSRRAGKNIYVGIDGEKFERVQVRNTEDGVDSRHPVIDITYKYKNKVSNNTFVNLSAMAGITSNFIFYKDRRGGGTDNEALIVYKPMEDYVPYKGKVDNTLKSQIIAGSPTQNEMYDITSTAFPTTDIEILQQDCLDADNNFDTNCNGFGSSGYKKMAEEYRKVSDNTEAMYKSLTSDILKRNALIKHLFVGSSGYDDIFPPNYMFKLFILNRVPDKTSREKTFFNFYNNMALNLSNDEFNTFFNSVGEKLDYDTGYIDSSKIENILKDDNEYYKNLAEKSVGGLYAQVLDVATSPAQAEPGKWGGDVSQFDLMVHDASGNLYMTLGEQGKISRVEQLKRYQYMFENNIFLTEKDSSDSFSSSDTNTQIFFKPRHIYENTPRNSIPLEVYAMGDGYFGGMFLTGGRRMDNFEKIGNDKKPAKEKKFKLSNASYASNTAINNYYESGEFKGSPGMFTKISADPIELNFDWIKDCKGEDCDTTVKKTPTNGILESKTNTEEKPRSFAEKMWDRIKGLSSNKNDDGDGALNFEPAPLKKADTVDLNAGFKYSKDNGDDQASIHMMKYLFWKSMEEFNKHLSENKEKGPVALNIYNAVFGAKIRPDEKDWKFLSESMTHSWGFTKTQTGFVSSSSYDLTSPLNTSNNFDLSKSGLKEGDNVVFLAVGMPKEFIEAANKNKGKYDNISEYTNTNAYQVFMIKSKVEKRGKKLCLTQDAYNFFNGIRTCKDGDKDCIEVDKRIKPLTNLKELKEFTDDFKLKVMFLPSVSIPYGTTLVNREGYLVFLPNSKYREEVQYATNTVNGLIYRMRMNSNQKEGATFLYQVPKGAVVRFGDKSNLIKASPMQNEQNKLKWVEMITSPNNTNSRFSWSEVSDYANLDWFLRGYANKIMIPYNTTSSEVTLKSIVGKGMYNVPAAMLITETINSLDRAKGDLDVQKAGRHFSDDVWVNTVTGKKVDNFIIDPIIGKKETGSGSEFPQGKIVEVDKAKSRSGEKAKLSLMLFLPPTIEVEKEKPGVEDAHYKVLMYHDIREFVVDPDDSYVQYMKERDTNAEELLKDFEQIQAEELDGRKYLSLANNKLTQVKINNILGSIEKFIPPIFMIIVFLIWIFYLGLQIPITQRLIVSLSNKFNMHIGEFDSRGRIDPKSLPSFITVFIVTVAFATTAVLIDSGVLIGFITKILIFFKEIIDKFIR